MPVAMAIPIPMAIAIPIAVLKLVTLDLFEQIKTDLV
jgi:hypothetical protein